MKKMNGLIQRIGAAAPVITLDADVAAASTACRLT